MTKGLFIKQQLQKPYSRIYKNAKLIVQHIARYVFLIAVSYVLLYPLLFMIANSVKTAGDAIDPTVEWIPKSLSLNGFKVAIIASKFWISLSNTFVYEIIAAVLSIISCAVAAYGLARFPFRGNKLLKGAMYLMILIPANMIIVPSFINFQHADFLGILKLLGVLTNTELRPTLIDTPLVFYLPSITSVGLKSGIYLFIFHQFFKGIPNELEEAAWIDGAGAWKTFLRIVIPSSGVAFLTVSIFSIIWHWNDYYLASMYLSENYPLSVVIMRLPMILVNTESSYLNGDVGISSIICAACLLFLIPVLLMYLILQKKFISSIATTGIVG